MTAPFKLLKEHGYFAKKEFGQNFLVDPSSPEMIIRKALVEPGSNIIEIGSGLGAMTIAAAKTAGFVYGIEKDNRLIPILQQEIKDLGLNNIEIINGDILKTDIKPLLSADKKNYIVGNLPYNISSQIIFKALEHKNQIEKCVFMLQKELAQRIASQNGSKDYGRISAVLQYHSEIKTIAQLKPNLFYPKPKVDSSVIEIDFTKPFHKKVENEDLFHEIIRLSFAQRRKTLKNSLGSKIKDKAILEEIFQKTNISISSRAEALSVEDYVNLTNAFDKALITK